jgi:hypothetical protein
VQTKTAQLLVCIVASEEEEACATQLLIPRSRNKSTTTTLDQNEPHILNRMLFISAVRQKLSFLLRFTGMRLICLVPQTIKLSKEMRRPGKQSVQFGLI